MRNERLLSWPLTAAALLVTFGFIFMLVDLLSAGFQNLSLNWIFDSPQDAGRSGGINSIIVSTGLIVILAIAVALPFSLLTAIFLYENAHNNNRQYELITSSLDILASVPSIVYGLFGYALFVIQLKLGFSILAGGLTLSCMLIPLLTRLFEISIRDEAQKHQKNALATGMTLTEIYFQVIIPAASKGLISALIIAIARALSETAALIYTSGYVYRMPESVLDSGRALSIHILDLSMNVPGGNTNASTSAVTLVLVLFLVNLVAMKVVNRQNFSNEVRI